MSAQVAISCGALCWFLYCGVIPSLSSSGAPLPTHALYRLVFSVSSQFFFFFFFFLGVPCSLWDISSLTRDQTHDPCGGSAEGFH